MGSIGNSSSEKLEVDYPEVPYVLVKQEHTKYQPVQHDYQLPTGIPVSINHAMLWKPEEVEQNRELWTVQLTTDEIASIEASMHTFIESGADLQSLTRETFPLPEGLTQRLDTISEACYNGLGFCVLRGLARSERSQLEKAVLFGGVSAHIASERGFQDIDRQHVLAHLFKRYPKQSGEYVPPSFDNAPLAFHTDDGDIVALYYPSFTKTGGRTQLVSQPLVYNKMIETRPELIKTLMDDWLIDTYYRPQSPPRKVPLLHVHGQHNMTIQYTRLPFSRYMGSRAPRADIPPLTIEQVAALDTLQTLSAQYAFPVPTEPGDILYFNNIGLFHGREPYAEPGNADTAPNEMDRHVLRLWLRDPKRTTQMTSPTLKRIWEEIYGPNTNKGRQEKWNVDAIAAFAMNADKNG